MKPGPKRKCRHKVTRTKSRACPVCKSAYMKRWRKAHPDLNRQICKEARRRWAGFDGHIPYSRPKKCEALCGRPAEHLDHDHVTGKFRGWLCRRCNAGIGMLGDRARDAIRLAMYLTKHNAALQGALLELFWKEWAL